MRDYKGAFAAVLTDISEAFDSLSNELLLSKLKF